MDSLNKSLWSCGCPPQWTTALLPSFPPASFREFADVGPQLSVGGG